MSTAAARQRLHLPGSKATSRAKGSYRNLGDLGSGRRRRLLCEYGGPLVSKIFLFASNDFPPALLIGGIRREAQVATHIPRGADRTAIGDQWT